MKVDINNIQTTLLSPKPSRYIDQRYENRDLEAAEKLFEELKNTNIKYGDLKKETLLAIGLYNAEESNYYSDGRAISVHESILYMINPFKIQFATASSLSDPDLQKDLDMILYSDHLEIGRSIVKDYSKSERNSPCFFKRAISLNSESKEEKKEKKTVEKSYKRTLENITFILENVSEGRSQSAIVGGIKAINFDAIVHPLYLEQYNKIKEITNKY